MLGGHTQQVLLAHHRLALGQVRGRKFHRLAPRQLVVALDPALFLAGAGLLLDRVKVDTDLRSALLPGSDQRRVINLGFARPGRQRGSFLLLRRGLLDVDPALLHGRRHVGATLTEMLDLLTSDPHHFKIALVIGPLQRVAQRLQPVSQFGGVDRPDDALGVVDFLVGERAPLPVLALGGVHDDGMRVGLRVQVAARVVAEHAHHQVAGLDRIQLAVLHLPGEGKFALGVPERRLHGGFMRLPDFLAAIDFREQRNTLGRRKREVDPRPVIQLFFAGGIVSDPLAQFLAAELAFQRRHKIALFDFPLKPQRPRALAEPRGFLQALVLGVVVVLREVVQRRAGAAEVVQRNHQRPPAISNTLATGG